ncbi:M23 family metallopeptidase [candidate division KSB1 bacterium]|nr:M23 family metallopeptidase [candidate division KSB1 bacterium]
MRNKQVKLIYFSLGGTELKQISLNWKKIIGYGFVGFTVVLVIISLALGLFTDLLHNWQVTNLTRSNDRLNALLSEMNDKVKTIEDRLQGIEKQDDDLRIFVDLPPINSDVRKLGVGGASNSFPIDMTLGSGNVSEQALKMKSLLDNLSQRVVLAVESRQEIMEKYYQNLRELKQTPSIRPLGGGRVSDKFGYRLDPIIDRFAHHDGVDFSAPRGTDVYASADGKVLEAITRYRPNHSYGKYVLIDHGYGRVTRYAHLETVLVKPGQNITRHTVIGKVGDTGKATGPHLHYEVIVDGKAVDPMNYIFD